jgi:hypothetical protein
VRRLTTAWLEQRLGHSLSSFPRRYFGTFCQPWSLPRNAFIQTGKHPTQLERYVKADNLLKLVETLLTSEGQQYIVNSTGEYI